MVVGQPPIAKQTIIEHRIGKDRNREQLLFNFYLS